MDYAGIILRIMVAKRIENYSGIIGGNFSSSQQESSLEDYNRIIHHVSVQ